MFAKILAAFDGSDLSKKALEIGVGLTLASKGELEVLYVCPEPFVPFDAGYLTVPADAEARMYVASQKVTDEAERIVGSRVQARTSVVIGYPSKTILDYAQENGFDLIVIGSRGLGAVREFLLGSVSHNIVQHAEIPVLVVK